MDPRPTGLIYGRKGLRLEAVVESIDSLKEFSRRIKGNLLSDFRKRYGDILELLNIPIQTQALTVLGQYWDDTLRCFTFSDFQIAPTMEEYGELLSLPLKKGDRVYRYPGYVASNTMIAKLLEISIDKLHLASTKSVEGVSRDFMEARLKELAEQEKWVVYNRVLAMIIYGIILFPFAKGVIDKHAISVFHMVEHHQVNPVPAILSETYMTMSFCHAKKGGRIRCCLQLLSVWIMNHLYGKRLHEGEKDNSSPLASFRNQEGKTKWDREGWIEVFGQLRADNVRWRLAWWWEDEILYRCGDFPNVLLLGPRGVINYNPMLLLRQYAFPQKVPSEAMVQRVQFYHDDSTIKMSQNVASAWGKVIYKGWLELGARRIYATEEYQAWLLERIKGVNPTFAPLDPLLSGNKAEVNMELAKQLQQKEEEVERLVRVSDEQKEAWIRLQGEYTTLQETVEEMRKQEACEVSLEVKRLKEENLKLKRTIRDVHVHMEENDQRMKNNRKRLMQVVKEKDVLEKEVQELRPLRSSSRELEIITKQLEDKVNELTAIKGDSSATIQRLLEQVQQRADAVENWRTLYSEKATETDRWRDRTERLIMLINSSIPRFSDVCKQAEQKAHPFDVPVEMSDFLLLCKELVGELRFLAQTW